MTVLEIVSYDLASRTSVPTERWATVVWGVLSSQAPRVLIRRGGVAHPTPTPYPHPTHIGQIGSLSHLLGRRGGLMPRAWSPCTMPDCPTLTPPGQSRCEAHGYDRYRPSARERGYGRGHETRFRPGVLAREPFCRLCYAPATVADHWPLTRRELVARGEDPDDPRHGRGLCVRCHNRETAKAQRRRPSR